MIESGKLTIFVLVSILLLPVAGRAAELTLEECVAQALAKNSGLKSAETAVTAAGEDLHIAEAGFLPSLQVTGEYSLVANPDRLIIEGNSFGPGVPPQDVSLSTGDHDQYAIKLKVKQPLFTGWSLTNAHRKAKSLGAEASHTLARQRKTLALEVKKAFNEVLNDQLRVNTVNKLMQAKQERLRVLRELLAEGYVSNEDVLLQETDLLFTEAELTKSNNLTAFSHSRLKQLMQYSEGDDLVLKGKPVNGNLAVSLQEVVQAGIANREDLQGALTRIRVAEAETGIARSGFYPQASLVGSYTRQKETNIAQPEVWMLAAQLEWQVFEWGRTTAAVKKANALKQGLTFERDELEKSVMLEVEKGWRDAQDRVMAVKAQEKRLKTVEYRMVRMLEKYGEGVAKLVDVVEVEADLIKDSNDYVMALNNLGSSLAQLEAATASWADNWFVEEGVYVPGIGSFDRQLQKLAEKKRMSELVEKPAEDNEPKENIATPQQNKMEENSPAPHAAAVVIQVGAFKSKRSAERLRKSLLAKAGSLNVSIVAEGSFYKVLLGKFAGKEDAALWAEQSGIKNYLVRGGNEFR